MRHPDATAVVAKVTEVVACYDGEPTDPPAQYTVLYDNAPHSPIERISATPVNEVTDFRLIVIARTTEGLRAAVTKVRQQLIRWRIADGYDPVRELQTGDVLPTGASGDRRLSQTLVFRYTRPFGGN